MPTPILMPALSPTMEVGNLAKWLVKEGDTVSSGDVIAEIETDKATMEVEAVDEGVVGKIVISEGTADVPVNETIAILLEEGEDASAIDSAASSSPAAPAPKADTPTETSSAAAPAAASQSAASAPSTPMMNGQAGRVFASPLAKRLASQNNIDISVVAGTGPHGRIIKRDIDKAIESGSAKVGAASAATDTPTAKPSESKPSTSAPAPSMSDDQVKALFEEGSYEELPHDGMRKVIASRLTESKQTVPHFYLTIECELDALLGLRKQINSAAPTNEEGKPNYKVSVNDFIIKAMALALQRVPMANASWTQNARLVHKHSDVGVAVAIPDGLFTPIIRKAETKTLSAISAEMKDLAGRARNRRLAPHEFQGGTTAVSNLGMFGIREFSAVINPPHGTILAVGAGEQRPVVKDGAVQIATVMSATLSCDHRVVDGALGAQLLAEFKKLIHDPMSMLV